MASIIDRLPAHAIPFVTRSLRGGRGRRFVALSLGLALLTLLGCLWIGLGEGRFARDRRVRLGMEQPTYVLEHREFVVIRDAARGELDLQRRQQWAVEKARRTVQEAIMEPPHEREHLELRARANTLAATWDEPEPGPQPDFSWRNPTHVQHLEKIVERGGVPAIVDYTPVVGLTGTLQLLAIVTGGLLLLLLTVVAPLLVALQQASEQHENTLQPLTGTGLGARELMLGLACGPLAIVAIFAAPIAALFVFAVVVAGPISTLLLVPAVVGTAIGLVFGAQLLAHLAGSRVAPGLIAAGLSILLGLVALIGLGLVGELDEGRFAAVFPQSGAFALLAEHSEAWGRGLDTLARNDIWLDHFVVPMQIGTLGAMLLGVLALHALTRYVEGRPTLLEFRHAMLGALVCITMVDVVIPPYSEAYFGEAEPLHHVFGLPMLALPFLLLIMARVPVGDVPTKLRRIPLVRLLGEFAGWTLIHLSVGVWLDRTAAGLQPIALLGVAWCVLVMVLVAVRLRATPGRLLGHFWTLVCLGMLPLTHAIASASAYDTHRLLVDAGEVPVLALIYLAAFVCVPASLFEHLRHHVARIQ